MKQETGDFILIVKYIPYARKIKRGLWNSVICFSGITSNYVTRQGLLVKFLTTRDNESYKEKWNHEYQENMTHDSFQLFCVEPLL